MSVDFTLRNHSHLQRVPQAERRKAGKTQSLRLKNLPVDGAPASPKIAKGSKMGICERIAGIRGQDHVRGCDGRKYSCDCGYEGDLDDVLAAASARLGLLEATLRQIADSGNSINAHLAREVLEDEA